MIVRLALPVISSQGVQVSIPRCQQLFLPLKLLFAKLWNLWVLNATTGDEWTVNVPQIRKNYNSSWLKRSEDPFSFPDNLISLWNFVIQWNVAWDKRHSAAFNSPKNRPKIIWKQNCFSVGVASLVRTFRSGARTPNCPNLALVWVVQLSHFPEVAIDLAYLCWILIEFATQLQSMIE